MKIILMLLMTLFCSGCAILTLGTATTLAVTTARQERTLGVIVDDTILAARVKNAFRKQDFQRIFMNVNVQVIDGSVFLVGIVDDVESKKAAIDIAYRTNGVKEVIDEIRLKKEINSTNYAKDAVITANIRSKLLLNKVIHSNNYTINTIDKIVYIVGITHSEEEKSLVLDIASRNKDVSSVVSYIKLIEN